MIHTIRNPSDADIVNTHFNAFHDGCLVSLNLSWGCVLGDDKSLLTSNELAAILTLSHYNYESARAPYHENVRVTLAGISDCRAEFSEFKACDWAIDHLSVESIGGGDSPKFRLLCSWCYLAGREWQTKEALRFVFRIAEITERD
jgi:hypothetical protein